MNKIIGILIMCYRKNLINTIDVWEYSLIIDNKLDNRLPFVKKRLRTLIK